MPAAINIIGQRFGRLFVIATAPCDFTFAGRALRRSLVICDCGKQFMIRNMKLHAGHTQSCGCFRRDKNAALRLKHGHACIATAKKSRTYASWQAMLDRCYRPGRRSWRYYGGAGITVCDRWRHSFASFLEDMGERPLGTSIDRYPNNRGNYEPGNCRWATPSQQNSNRRRG